MEKQGELYHCLGILDIMPVKDPFRNDKELLASHYLLPWWKSLFSVAVFLALCISKEKEYQAWKRPNNKIVLADKNYTIVLLQNLRYLHAIPGECLFFISQHLGVSIRKKKLSGNDCRNLLSGSIFLLTKLCKQI